MTQDYAQARPTAFDDIPIVDLNDIGHAAGFGNFCDKVTRTAADVGFFYITGHGIDPALRVRAFAASRRFFALPREAKSTVTVNQMQRGWLAQGQTRLEGSDTHDAKEVFFWGYDTPDHDTDVLAGVPLVAPNQWPTRAAPWLRQDIQPYYQAVLSLSAVILAALAKGLGQDAAFFKPFYQKPLGRGQLVYYPCQTAQDRNDRRMGAAAHTDFGVLTILAQDDLGGLQVQNSTGDWIEAPPVTDSLVCNIGDLLQMWTGGQLRSTVHRVINRAHEPRYSIPIFCDPASTTPIDPSDFGAPKPQTIITAGEHIAKRNHKNFSHYQRPSK